MTDQLPASALPEHPFRVGMLLYPGMTLLDVAGPQTAWGIHGKTFLLSKTLEPVPTDTRVAMVPTHTLDECPADLDVLFVPGGMGTNGVLKDKETLAFLAEHGPKARYVTAVCTGTIILAAAGLLDGYKAATHWAYYDQLAATPTVAPVHARVVVDRNRITGGGVTAGIDFGLSLLALLHDEDTAKLIQLLMEYDPQPPYSAGTPDLAGPAVTAMASEISQGFLREGIQLSRELYESRLPVSA